MLNLNLVKIIKSCQKLKDYLSCSTNSLSGTTSSQYDMFKSWKQSNFNLQTFMTFKYLVIGRFTFEQVYLPASQISFAMERDINGPLVFGNMVFHNSIIIMESTSSRSIHFRSLGVGGRFTKYWIFSFFLLKAFIIWDHSCLSDKMLEIP